MTAAPSIQRVPWWSEVQPEQWRTLLASWAGWVLDAFDFTLVLLVLGDIAKTFGVGLVAMGAAVAEALKRGWPEDIAVTDSGANLVAFLRMDGALLGSIALAEHKARASVKFRRPTKAFEDAIQGSDFKYLLAWSMST